MCGNGGRCIAAFARKLGIIKGKADFLAADGVHRAELIEDEYIRLKMSDVKEIETGNDHYFLNTGSPHYVKFYTSIADLDVFSEGRKIRYGERFSSQGTNVNFVEDRGDHIYIRTYERGVENETLACGTGVVASALCTMIRRGLGQLSRTLPVKVMGGQLKVTAEYKEKTFINIWLEGPATFVYQGNIELDKIQS
jgi:diaminopimelate epimerase